jgi:hypothetical protein
MTPKAIANTDREVDLTMALLSLLSIRYSKSP